jgi:hypothetical protein
MEFRQDDLPEDHAALIELAYGFGMAGVPVTSPYPQDDAERWVPAQRPVVRIPDECTPLVAGPLVGFSTHGR